MSEVRNEEPTFMTLYDQGLVTAEQGDDAVEAWHASGDDERRSLAEYLGMTDTEYYIWCMAPGSLPIISQARREDISLRELLIPYVSTLRSGGDPAYRPVVHALGHWLEKPAPDRA